MSYLHKQPQRLYINIEDGGRRYQQFEKPWPELDLTITEEKVHDFISNSEVKKKSSHDSTDIMDICNLCTAIHENKKSMPNLIYDSEVKKSSHDSTDENKKSRLYSLAPLQKSPVLAALTPQ